jgi:hypothetical protein
MGKVLAFIVGLVLCMMFPPLILLFVVVWICSALMPKAHM